MWPLSNEARSKQYLQLLTSPDGTRESLMQRFARHIAEAGIDAGIVIATTAAQKDPAESQFGSRADVVLVPESRGTFAATALAAAYIRQHCSGNEAVVVIPADLDAEPAFFTALADMAQAITDREAEVAQMTTNSGSEIFALGLDCTEKLTSRYIPSPAYETVRDRYDALPRNTLGDEIAAQACPALRFAYDGKCRRLDTWADFTEEMPAGATGRAIVGENADNTHIINELDIPLICLGTQDVVVAASPDGILVSDKKAASRLNGYAGQLTARPMYEERRWGTYKVMGVNEFPDGGKALTKLLHLKPGCHISYQYHNQREEIWTFVDGEGRLIIDGEEIRAVRGYVAHIKAGQKHTVHALTDLRIIEVQIGKELIEEDIVRLDWKW